MGDSTGFWSTTPLPFNAQLAWSLEPGAEYFVFAYSQHRFTNRQAVPLLIARDQISGHWILAATPPSTASADGLRAVCWDKRSGQPCGSRGLIRDPLLTSVRISRPAELALATSDWSSFSSANVPAYRLDPLILPPDFASLNISSAAQSYYKPADGSEWLALGGHGLLLRTKEGPGAEAQR